VSAWIKVLLTMFIAPGPGLSTVLTGSGPAISPAGGYSPCWENFKEARLECHGKTGFWSRASTTLTLSRPRSRYQAPRLCVAMRGVISGCGLHPQTSSELRKNYGFNVFESRKTDR
jgi:hypothetical protein